MHVSGGSTAGHRYGIGRTGCWRHRGCTDVLWMHWLVCVNGGKVDDTGEPASIRMGGRSAPPPLPPCLTWCNPHTPDDSPWHIHKGIGDVWALPWCAWGQGIQQRSRDLHPNGKETESQKTDSNREQDCNKTVAGEGQRRWAADVGVTAPTTWHHQMHHAHGPPPTSASQQPQHHKTRLSQLPHTL